jgi:hypothetical protein
LARLRSSSKRALSLTGYVWRDLAEALIIEGYMHKNSKIKKCQNARCDKEYFLHHGNLKYCSPQCKSQSKYWRHHRYITAYRRLFMTEYHKKYNKEYYKNNKDYFRLYGIAYRGRKADALETT